MISDDIKAATILCLWNRKVAVPVQAAEAAVAKIREAITGNNLVGEFTQPQLSAMLAVEFALQSLVALPGIASAAAADVSSHRGQAITIQGVND